MSPFSRVLSSGSAQLHLPNVKTRNLFGSRTVNQEQLKGGKIYEAEK